MAAEPTIKKVLVCGSVQGQFEQLVKRVNSLHTGQAGPFSLLVCVGPFFKPYTNTQEAQREQLAPFLNASLKIPLPAVFSDEIFSSGEFEVVCPNLICLGRVGVTTVEGLRVAFVSSSSLPRESEFFEKAKSNAPADIFISRAWPAHIDKYLVENKPPAVNFDSSETVAHAAALLCPRYHFACPGAGAPYWERTPYTSSAGGSPTVTRFIGMGSCFHENKQKFIYAMTINTSQPFTVPPNATGSPYEAPALSSSSSSSSSTSSSSSVSAAGKKHGIDASSATHPPEIQPQLKRSKVEVPDEERFGSTVSGGFNRWGLSDTEVKRGTPAHEGGAGGGRQDRGPRHQRGGRGQDGLLDTPQGGGGGGRGGGHSRGPPPPPGPCWFCLSNPSTEKHLVVSVGTEVYAALPKGPLADGHCLLLPIAHAASFAELPESVLAELERYKQGVAAYFRTFGKIAVFLERNIPSRSTQHVHIEAVPIGEEALPDLFSGFDSEGANANVPWTRGETGYTSGGAKSVRAGLLDWLRENSGSGVGYFLIETPSNTLLHKADPNKFVPMNLGRQVLANVLQVPDRVDWKRCVLDKGQETSQAQTFRKAFRAFDPTATPGK